MPGAGRRTFTITEQRRTGAGALIDTPVRFVWDARTHSKPIRGIETPLQVVTARDLHPGTRQPVEQILGVAWEPFEFEGVWDDKWAGSGFAAATHREITALVSRGGFVRIEWDQQDYTGILTNYTPTHLDETKIRYKFTFSPHDDPGGGDVPIVPPAPRPTRTYVDQVDAIVTAAEELQGGARDVQLADDTYADLQTHLDEWRSGTDELDSLSDAFGETRNAAEFLRRQGARFGALRTTASNLIIDTAVASAGVRRAFDDGVQELRIDHWVRELTGQAHLMITRSREAQDAMEDRAESTPARIYRPFAGQNVYSVSLDVYGTTEGWRAIMRANNLSIMSFDGTEILTIPETPRAAP